MVSRDGSPADGRGEQLGSAESGGDGPDWLGWGAAWERHMTGFFPQRGVTLDLLADLVARMIRPDAVIWKLGAGVGTLGERLLQRLPNSQVVALEFDPLLRRIGEERLAPLGDRIAWCSADLTDPSWDGIMPAPPDAVVSVATLHGLGGDVTRQVYRRVAERLASSGVFVNLDFAAVPADRAVGAAVAALTEQRNDRAAETAFSVHRAALAADPLLAPLADERDRLLRIGEWQTGDVEEPAYLDVEQQRLALATAGFRTVDVPWQQLDLSMLVATV